MRVIGALVLAFLLTAAGREAAHAGPGLVITPQRVVLADRNREVNLTIANTGDEAGAFRLFFVNYRMTELGAFEPVTEPEDGAPFLSPLARFSPRQVVLAPGESQSVRVMISRPAEMAPGEYRSHLVFQNVPRKSAGDGAGAKGRARAAIKSLYGLSIPVIYRIKTRDAKAAIEAASVYADAASRPVLAVTISRTGNESLYGDLRITFRPAGAKKFTPFLESNGNAIYTPLEKRTFLLPAPALPPAGTLRVEYRTPDTVMAGKDVEVR